MPITGVTQFIPLILKNLKLILIACVLAGGAFLLWQYVSTQVQAKASQIEAQAATAALQTQVRASTAANTAVSRSSVARQGIHTRHTEATKQAEKAKEKNHEWSDQVIPADALAALNGV